MDKTIKALTRAIELTGSRAELARQIKSKPSTIQYWLAAPKRTPAEYCKPIQEATGGKVKAADLRPDIF
jgi:DNA-binding transcriptional regulator YdaS (Cro superfamily)